MPTYLNNVTNPCDEIPLYEERAMPEPVYGLDTDGVMHLWYAQGTRGWSGCGQKERADFVSFAYVIEGRTTCIGCLATEGTADREEKHDGLLVNLLKSLDGKP